MHDTESAAKINLPTIKSGASYNHVIRWSTKDAAGVVTPMDLTGYSARLQVKSKATDEVALVDWATADVVDGGELTLDGNTITIEAGVAATAGLVFTDKPFDLLVWPTATPDKATRIAYGVVSAERVITSLPTP